MARKRVHRGDSRHVVVDFAQISRTQRILGIIAGVCIALAFVIPALQGWLLLVGLFAGVAIGWVE